MDRLTICVIWAITGHFCGMIPIVPTSELDQYFAWTVDLLILCEVFGPFIFSYLIFLFFILISLHICVFSFIACF